MFASKLLSHYFQGRYTLRAVEISQKDLLSLLFIYKTDYQCVIEDLKTKLLIDSENLSYLLPRLKNCLINSQFFGAQLPPNMAQIVTDIPNESLNDERWNDLWAQMKQKAIIMLERPNMPGMFPAIIDAKEKELLTSLKNSDATALRKWIDAQHVAAMRGNELEVILEECGGLESKVASI